MHKQDILKAFKLLNKELQKDSSKAEICIVGGAVICLVFNARSQTKDVAAILHPKQKLYQLANRIAVNLNLPKDWLNDSVKGFIESEFEKIEVFTFSHLSIFAPPASYILAMKCIAARADTKDLDDIKFLIKYLKLKSAKEVFDIIENYYPPKSIMPKTVYLIEELFENFTNN